MYKFLFNGQEAKVIQKLEDGFLVKPIYEDQSDDCRGDRIDDYFTIAPIVVNQVYDSAPTARYDKKIIALKCKINELNHQIEQAEIKKDEIEKDLELKNKFLEANPCTKLVQDFLNKKITHLVVLSNYMESKLIEFSSLKSEEHYKAIFPIITLAGDAHFQTIWKITCGDFNNEYNCHPFTSKQEALEFLKKDVLERFSKSPQDFLIDTAQKFGFADDLDKMSMDKYKKERKDFLLNKIKDLNNKMKTLNDSISKISTEISSCEERRQ